MRYPRSTVDDALLAQLTMAYAPSLGQWKVASKHWQSWGNTTNQPAIYLKRVKEGVSQVSLGQNRYELFYEAWVYAQYEISNPNTDPYDTVVNPILDAIDQRINPQDPDDRNTLGLPGIANARIKGDIDVADGSVDGQVLLVIPISVFTGV